MSQKREKHKRLARRWVLDQLHRRWLLQEPPKWRFIRHKRWKRREPTMRHLRRVDVEREYKMIFMNPKNWRCKTCPK